MSRDSTSIDALIQNAVADALRKVTPTIQRHIAAIAAQQLEENLAVSSARRARAGRARSRPREELTRWVADRNARRVPKFVIELTGLDTKKKIVARYGEDAAFDKGKPAPKANAADGAASSPKDAAREVRSRAPVVRKAAAR